MSVADKVARYYVDTNAAVADWRELLETFDDVFTLVDWNDETPEESMSYTVAKGCGNLAGNALAESVREFVRAVQRVDKYVSTDRSKRVDLELLKEWASEIDRTFSFTKSSEKLVDLVLRVQSAFNEFAEEVDCDSVVAATNTGKLTSGPLRNSEWGCDPFLAIRHYQKRIKEAGAWGNLQARGTLREVLWILYHWLDDIARSKPMKTKEKWWSARRELIGLRDGLFHFGAQIKAADAIGKLPVSLADLEAVRFILDETVFSPTAVNLLEIDSPEAVDVPGRLCQAVARLWELVLVAWHFDRTCPPEPPTVAEPPNTKPKPPSRWPDADRDAIRDSLSRPQQLKLFNVLWAEDRWTYYGTLKNNRADKLWRGQPDPDSIDDDTVFEALRKLQKDMSSDWPYSLKIEHESKRAKIIPPEKPSP